jgi:RNA polymerase sigma factor (sigma-70 family)
LEDANLIERARRGDVRAYEELVRKYQEVAFRSAYIITKDPAEAEEATQEAFVKAYYALHRFRGDASFRSWLLRIVVNESHNRIRAAKRRTNLRDRTAWEQEVDGRLEKSPERELLTAERRLILLQALAELRVEDRIIVAHRYFLDMTEKEIAEMLDCPRGTVKSRLSRAIKKLRRRMEGKLSDSGQTADIERELGNE